MFKNIDYLCYGGVNAAKNEDFIGCTDDFLFVIDGATSLMGNNIFNSQSDAKWFSTRLGEMLYVALKDLKKSIPLILNTVLKQLRDEFDYQAKILGVPIDYPSASILIFRVNKNKIEMYRLGDCLGIVQFKSGRTEILDEKLVAYLDNLALREQYNKAKMLNISVKDARPLINTILIENRKKRNTKGGYWILDPTGIGVDYGEYKLYSRDKIDNISAMTDGYFSIVTVYKVVGSFKELQESLKIGEMQKLYLYQYNIQESDKDYNKFPRFKLRDDSGVVFAKIC